MVFVIPWAILALDFGIPAGMTGAHEGVASFFGESGFFFTGAGSGYILGPGDMGPKYSALSTDDDDGEPSAKASKPMSQEEFAAWLEEHSGRGGAAEAPAAANEQGTSEAEEKSGEEGEAPAEAPAVEAAVES